MTKTLGILGGGQLGRMMLTPCINLGIDVRFLDPNPDCSVSDFTSHLTIGDFNDYQTVLDFGRQVDVLTVEIEHVSVDALEQLEKEGVKVHPSSKILRTIQDKAVQKTFYQQNNIPSSAFQIIETSPSSKEIEEKLLKSIQSLGGFPVAQKTRTGGYDGQGVQLLQDASDLEKAFHEPSLVESLVDIDKEIGVIVARNTTGQVQVFPPVEMIFDPNLNLVKYVVCPANITPEQHQRCLDIAHTRSLIHYSSLVSSRSNTFSTKVVKSLSMNAPHVCTTRDILRSKARLSRSLRCIFVPSWGCHFHPSRSHSRA